MMGLTQRQRECLNFICAQVREKGIAPSYREIKDALGVTSKGTVGHLLKGLVERGHIKLNPRRRRSIKLVEPKYDHAADCLCAACPARRLQYEQLIEGLQTEAKFLPGVTLIGLRPLSDLTRLHWKRGFPQRHAATPKRTAIPSGVR